jgi:tRNA(fMet)-specific endonuclease VapC
MALFLLDTSTLTHFQRGHPRVIANHAAHATDTIAITTITVEETIGGWFALLQRARNNAQEAQASRSLADATGFLAQFPIYPVSEAMLDRFDRLVRLKLNVGTMDLKIAAVALELGGTVVTSNVLDFQRVNGLSWEDWAR